MSKPMDLTKIPAPVFTTLDGVTQAVAAICYVSIGAAAWARASSDIRTRVFLAIGLANLVVFGVPTLWWLRGTTDPTKLPVAATAAITAGLGVGALLLFHFSQVFPRRRPWIRTSGVQMSVAYFLVPVAIAGLIWFAPPTLEAVRPAYMVALIVFGFPLVVLLGIVLPVTAVVSLARSHHDLRQSGAARLKRTVEVILLSQIGGGTLAVVFAPVLTTAAPNSLSLSILTVIIWLLGLLTPLAYAAAVWKCDVLSISPD
jgi:hypothetical protein